MIDLIIFIGTVISMHATPARTDPTRGRRLAFDEARRRRITLRSLVLGASAIPELVYVFCEK